MATDNMLSNVVNDGLWEVARACRIMKMEGHGDLTMGHLSWRDPEGRGFWMKRCAIGLGEVRAAADFVLLDFDGNKLHGDGVVHVEWPLHGEILRARSDLNVIGHTHPFYATTFSATNQPLQSIAHEGVMLAEEIPYYTGTSALVDTIELGLGVVESLGSASSILMRNHGITYCGPTSAAAVLNGVFLEKACKAQLMLTASGLPWSCPDQEEFDYKAGQLAAPALRKAFWDYFNRELDRAEGVRDLNQQVELPAA